jgi:hypothetical protein
VDQRSGQCAYRHLHLDGDPDHHVGAVKESFDPA